MAESEPDPKDTAVPGDLADIFMPVVMLCRTVQEFAKQIPDDESRFQAIMDYLEQSPDFVRFQELAGFAVSEGVEPMTACVCGMQVGIAKGFALAVADASLEDPRLKEQVEKLTAWRRRGGENTAKISRAEFAEFVYPHMKKIADDLKNVTMAATRTAEALARGDVIPDREVEISTDRLRARFNESRASGRR